MMFRLMSFFMSFHHQLHQGAVKDATETRRQGGDSPKFELGYVLETMDLMSFNLVLREAETAISEKNTKRLAECVAVLKEMMHIMVCDFRSGCCVVGLRCLGFTLMHLKGVVRIVDATVVLSRILCCSLWDNAREIISAAVLTRSSRFLLWGCNISCLL